MSRQRAPVRPVTVDHRAVLAIAVPMTLAHLSTPLLGIADTAVIGQLGDAALLGAVALCSLCCSTSSSGASASCAWARPG